MIPQLVRAAEATGQMMYIEWNDFRAVASPKGARFDGGNIMAASVHSVTCGIYAKEDRGTLPPATNGFEVENSDWSTLATSAHRTYAPASDESRLSGAGAGLSDND